VRLVCRTSLETMARQGRRAAETYWVPAAARRTASTTTAASFASPRRSRTGPGSPALDSHAPSNAPRGAAARSATARCGPAVGRWGAGRRWAGGTQSASVRERQPGSRGPAARPQRHRRAPLVPPVVQVHTLPGPAPAGVVPRVPRSTLAFRERRDAAARARLGQGSSWAASRRALCGQEPSALGRLRAHRRGAGGLVTISRLWISLRSPGCRLVSCGSTTPTATARAHMGSTALARCRRGAARDGWPWPQRGACPARWSATPSGGSWQRGPLRRALLGDICSQGWAFHSHPGRVRVSGPVLTSGHGPERAARRYLQPLDYMRLMATFLAFGLLAAGGQNERYVHARLSVSARRQQSYAPRPVGRGRRSAPAWSAAGRQSRLCLVGGPRSRLAGPAGPSGRHERRGGHPVHPVGSLLTRLCSRVTVVLVGLTRPAHQGAGVTLVRVRRNGPGWRAAPRRRLLAGTHAPAWPGRPALRAGHKSPAATLPTP